MLEAVKETPTMAEAIEEYYPVIKRHVFVALTKMKKPPDHDFNDLMQEGVQVFLQLKKLGSYDKSRNCSFRSFFIGCLRQHFGNLVRKSYRNLELQSKNEFLGPLRTNSCNPLDVVTTLSILDNFSPEEQEYIRTIFTFTDRPFHFRRKLTREILGITRNREIELRNAIWDKIKK